MDNNDLIRAISESGFPLQLGLKQLLDSVPNWHCESNEHPWRDPLTNDEKFIDLVVIANTGHQSMVVECKRAKDTQWIFLRDPAKGQSNDRLIVRGRVVSVVPSTNSGINEWIDVTCFPGSPQAEFCVIRKSGQRSQELLEKTAAEITRAANALAEQALSIHNRAPRGLAARSSSLGHLYVPVIVTTAQLLICDADYSKLDWASGEVPDAQAIGAPVIRFHKSLGSGDPESSRAMSHGAFADENGRSVLIVEASHFAEFLNRWELTKSNNRTTLEHIFA